ncbi:hypothetical protein JW835_03690 [bacterium]|nr:hypothetical protein [bacterium]RQV98247.1 MAG: hypothetical protein EH221_02425 [bacterium]
MKNWVRILRFAVFLSFIVHFLLPAKADFSLLLPSESVLTGWETREAPDVYNPPTLYEYINGEAELYHRYGFVRLVTQTYYRSDSEDSSITVNLYDMGSPENAFGIYASYRYPDYQYENLGAEAIVSEYNIKFYQGQAFVDISAWDSGPVYSKGMHLMATEISKKIQGEKTAPEITTLLPRKHRIVKTLKYHPKEMLNQSFLGAGIEADYEMNQDRGTGFIVFCESDSAADASVSRLKTFYQNMGDSLVPDEQSEVLVIFKNDRDEYLIFCPRKSYILGSRGFKRIKTGQILIQETGKSMAN